MKIIITGGHLTPALAVMRELKKHPGIEIIFIGRQYTDENKLTLSYEYSQIEKLGIPFIHLTTGKFYRQISFSAVINLIKVFLGLLQSLFIIRDHRPDRILSFGGYIGLPISLVAGLFRIPLFIHEQTIMPGLANKISARFAKKIFIAFPETKQYFPFKKTHVVGNPLRKEVFQSKTVPFINESTKPIIYITGGSLGAHSLNLHIENILSELLKKFVVIHQTGNVADYRDYERLSKISLEYKNYIVRTHIFNSEIGWVFKNSSLIVSRAGANTIFELIALQKPAVLIPLPWSAAGEQKAHAELLASYNAVEVFDQNNESIHLLESIMKVYSNRSFYKDNYRQLQKYIVSHPAEEMVKAITGSISKTS